MRQTITRLVLLAGVIAILGAPVNLGAIGTGDWRAHWSASYLLRHGDNFASREQLYKVQQEQTSSDIGYPLISWNPPWLLVLLEPYTLVSFTAATWWWFLTSLALAFAGTMLLWRHLAKLDTTRRRIWIPAVLLISFSPVFVDLMSGQVDFIVLFGLAVLIVQWDLGGEWSTGAALALTMVKPHLVYITLPIVLLECARRRRLRILLGFVLVMCVLTITAFVQRPSFVSDYIATATSGALLDWQHPTVGAWLDLQFGWHWARLLGVAILPVVVIIWLFRPPREMSRLVEVTLFLSIISAPYGWSYDHVLLLIPLVHVMIDLMESGIPRVYSLLWMSLLILVDAAIFWTRTTARNDVYFFWVPLVVAAIYFMIRWQVSLGNSNGIERSFQRM